MADKPGFSRKMLAGVSLLALAIVSAAIVMRVERSGGSKESGSPLPPVPVAESQKESPKNAPAKATAVLLIVPWGEVYVDGQKRGISPPLKSISLAPGMHTVEIRNSNLPVHLEKIEAKPGAQIRIKHKF
jgi:hypothetical protein